MTILYGIPYAFNMLDFTSQPASLTKHLDSLSHPLPRQVSTLANIPLFVELQQKSSASSTGTGTGTTGTTGTTLWLGAQLMAAYLSETLPFLAAGHGTKKKVIELGGGVGYLAIVLAVMGYDVTTTDIDPPLTHVLRPNIARNATRMSLPHVTAADLDWFTFPSLDSEHIASLDDKRSIPEGCQDWLEPWEAIVTTDTIYHADLVHPLLKTLRTLSVLAASAKRINTNSNRSDDQSLPSYPSIYVALENRDPALVKVALDSAKDYGFTVKRISQTRVDKCLAKSGWSWDRDAKQDYDGIQIWKWRLSIA